jgi:hypothetical protein
MKKQFFFFAMLASVTASAQMTNVAPISANYANKTVSFRVWWNAGSRDATHLSKVWVWVDYIEINSNNTTSGNTWTRATVGSISGGATSYDGDNRKGFWLEGNATTNYSATLTVQLTNVPDKFNWCAYVSDFPPNVTANGTTYTLHGTPPFTLIASNGTTKQTVSGTTITTSALTMTPITMTDKTECPGVFCAMRDKAKSSLICCAGLTVVGDYCRDLIADDASTYTGCGFEIKRTDQGKLKTYGSLNNLCPNGWRWPTLSEGMCICQNKNLVGNLSCCQAMCDDYIRTPASSNTVSDVWMGDCNNHGENRPWSDYDNCGGIRVRCVR